MQVPRDNRRSILLPLAFFILTLAITWVLEPRKMRQVPLCSSLRERHPCLLQVNISTQHYLLLTPFPCRWSWPHYVCVHTQTCPTLVTPWTVPYQAHLSMGFSRQEYWSGVPLPSPLSLGPFLYFKFPPLWLVNVLHSPFFLWNNNFAQIYQLRSRRKTSYILQLSLTEFTEGLFDRCKRE